LSIFVMTWARTRDWCCHSVTEDEEKPLQYPTIFNSADVAVITKMDLVGGSGLGQKCLNERGLKND
jgi:Ni2+-binding GTPase involved in maturation of urease and hydrogenase